LKEDDDDIEEEDLNQIEDCVESVMASHIGILNKPYLVEPITERIESPLKLKRAEYSASLPNEIE
jgi:hypothetical protein